MALSWQLRQTPEAEPVPPDGAPDGANDAVWHIAQSASPKVFESVVFLRVRMCAVAPSVPSGKIGRPRVEAGRQMLAQRSAREIQFVLVIFESIVFLAFPATKSH